MDQLPLVSFACGRSRVTLNFEHEYTGLRAARSPVSLNDRLRRVVTPWCQPCSAGEGDSAIGDGGDEEGGERGQGEGLEAHLDEVPNLDAAAESEHRCSQQPCLQQPAGRQHEVRQRDKGTQEHHGDEPDDEQRDDGRQLRTRPLLTGFACRTAETALPDAEDGHDRGEQQHSGEFDDDRDRERSAADDASGRDDLRDFMDGTPGPHPGRLGVQAKQVREQWDEGNHQRSEDHHEGDRGDGVFLGLVVRVGDPCRARHGCRAADGESAGNEQREPGWNPQQPPQENGAEQTAGDNAHDDDQHWGSEVEDVGQYQLESEEDDAGAQELFRGEVDAVGGRCWQPDDVGQEYAKHDRDNERADSRQQQADPVRCSGRGQAEDKPGQERADSGKQRV